MICDACGKDCAKTYRVDRDGKEVDVNVCPECYASLYSVQTDVDNFQFLGSVGERASKVCPVCGTSFEVFQGTGLLGCADCYNAFREDILHTVRFIQWGEYHTGNPPSRAAENRYDLVRELVKEQNALQKEYTHALKEKDYGEVQRVKKRMAEIKKLLNGEDD